jgi:hypothetical protein
MVMSENAMPTYDWAIFYIPVGVNRALCPSLAKLNRNLYAFAKRVSHCLLI